MRLDVERIISELEVLHARTTAALRGSVEAYIMNGTMPDPAARAEGAFAYPELRLVFSGVRNAGPRPRADRRYVASGEYRTTVTRPQLFRRYLAEQLTALDNDYIVEASIVRSGSEIPFPYVIDGVDLAQVRSSDLAELFPATELAMIGDEITDGVWRDRDGVRPLAQFDALRTDFSLARLRHYTGTPAEHFQQYVLFTNYHRYVDAFVRWGCAQLLDNDNFAALSCAGGTVHHAGVDPEKAVADGAWRRHQMPAYHLMTERGDGISLVNIGVGPSNAKTLTDHLAVLRPEAWVMIGHCGGLSGRVSRSATTYSPTPICATITFSIRYCRPKCPCRPSRKSSKRFIRLPRLSPAKTRTT